MNLAEYFAFRRELIKEAYEILSALPIRDAGYVKRPYAPEFCKTASNASESGNGQSESNPTA
jgi:hypothetical protein